MINQSQRGNRQRLERIEIHEDGVRIERRLDLILRLSNSLETLHDIRIDDSLRASRPDDSSNGCSSNHAR